MKISYVLAGLILAAITASSVPLVAEAQGYRNDNPNMRNFYMARQQIQITDDAPAVNDMRTNPGAAPANITAPRALPRAGFGSFVNPSLTNGSMSSGLPQVVNGVPKAPPPSAAPVRKSPTGQRATANKIKPSGPTTVKAYKPYQTYQAAAPAGGGTGGGMINNSSSNVSGSVLHWNRRKSLQY